MNHEFWYKYHQNQFKNEKVMGILEFNMANI